MKKLLRLIFAMLVLSSSVFAQEDVYINLESKELITTNHLHETNISLKNIGEGSKFSICFDVVDKDGNIINQTSYIRSVNTDESLSFKSLNKISKDAYYMNIYVKKDGEITSNTLRVPIKDRDINALILNIEPIEKSITNEEEFEIPKQAKALLSNGELIYVDVNWQLDGVDITNPGTHTIYGLVKGTDKKAKLILNVKEIGKITGVKPVVIQKINEDPITLPKYVIVEYSDGSSKKAKVTWESLDENKLVDGENNFTGIVDGTDFKASLIIIVKRINTSDQIDFNNKELEALIKEQTGLEKLTLENLSEVEMLSFQWQEFSNTDLSELRYLKNLKVLDLSYYFSKINLNDIYDLKNLEELNLFAGQISSLNGIEGLANLKTLNLRTCSQIKDLTPVSCLENLENIYISGTAVKNIEALDIPTLRNVELGQIDIGDYSPLLGIENLKVDVAIEKEVLVDGILKKDVKAGEKYYLPYKAEINGKITRINWDEKVFEGNEDKTVEGITEDGERVKAFISLNKNFEDRVISFPDKGLEKAVRSAIDKYKGDIYLSDVINLKELEALALGITNLDGIENLEGLEKLSLWANHIESHQLAKLKGLKNLKYLDLANNYITDIPLGTFVNMNNLIELVLDENKISFIDENAFDGLNNLENLLIEENKISNINFVKNLTSLKFLFLRYNNISDISPVKNLVNVTSLWLTSNNISDISPVANMKDLDWFNIKDNKVSDLSPLSGKANLYRIDFSNNNVKDISMFSDNLKMEWFAADNNKIESVEPLRKLTNLTSLQLKNNEIRSCEPLKDLVNLRILYLSGNKITDFSPVWHYAKDIKAKDFIN